MKKTILIDVDDVVCENHFHRLVNEFLAKNGKPIFKTLDGLLPNYEELIFKTPEEQKAFDDFYLSHDSYEGLNPIEGSVDVIKRLGKLHDVFFVTSCVHGHRQKEFARQYVDKFNWLMDNFPFIPPNHIIATNVKRIFKADSIIDDRIKHLTGEYKTKILFSSFHNKNITQEELEKAGAVRADNWKQIGELLL